MELPQAIVLGLVLALFAIIIGTAVVLTSGDSLFHPDKATPNSTITDNVTVACPSDARQCPDGSYVGRVAPTCQFSTCPDGTIPGYSEDGQKEIFDTNATNTEAP